MKKIFLLILVTLLFVGCNKDDTMADELNRIITEEKGVVTEKEFTSTPEPEPSQYITANYNNERYNWIVEYEVYVNGYHTNGYVIIRNVSFVNNANGEVKAYNINANYVDYINNIHNDVGSLCDNDEGDFRVIFRIADCITLAHITTGEDPVTYQSLLIAKDAMEGRLYGVMKK